MGEQVKPAEGAAAERVVKEHFRDMPYEEACQKLEETSAVLRTIQESGIDTVEEALEAVKIAGAITLYFCADGLYAAMDAERGPKE